jgi:hypothetical protein
MGIVVLPNFFLVLLVVWLPLAGCGSSGYLRVQEADWRLLGQQIGDQEERLGDLGAAQASTHGVLLESYHVLLEQLNAMVDKQEELLRRQQEWEDEVRSTRLRRLPDPAEEWVEEESPAYATLGGDKQVVGSVEKIYLAPPGVLLSARIDTGAATSSLDARSIEHFERNGERWVRFTLFNPAADDNIITLERKVVRNVRIIQAVLDEPERRPVVELGVTVGRTTQTAQFTLSARGHLEHPVLIGRNVLMDIMVVDVGLSHIAPPHLPPAANSDRTVVTP